MVDLKKLDELRDKLATAESFGDVMDYFLDHFGENPEFMALGKRVKSPLMNAVVQRVAEELLGPGARVTGKHFVLLKKQRFIHGAPLLDGRISVLIFFRDIDMGMLAFSIGEETKFVRFTSYTVKGKEPLAFSPTPSKLIH
ncbi:MAG TPA: hypothetical protein VGG06_32910 [Thermoanaerobaculia bacterium]|jgi:hypothetical protein